MKLATVEPSVRIRVLQNIQCLDDVMANAFDEMYRSGVCDELLHPDGHECFVRLSDAGLLHISRATTVSSLMNKMKACISDLPVIELFDSTFGCWLPLHLLFTICSYLRWLVINMLIP